MMVEDLLQLLQFLHRRNKGLFHSMIGNQLSALMSKEMMLGLTIKLIRQMKLNGKLTFLQSELTILTQLRLQMRRSKLMKLKLHLWFKERDKSTQLEIAHPTSHHTPKETTHGMMPSTTNLMRLPGVERPIPLLLITSTGLPMMVADLHQLLQFLPRRDKNGFHSTTLNQQSLPMTREMMPGLITKLTRLTRLNGKLISQL